MKSASKCVGFLSRAVAAPPQPVREFRNFRILRLWSRTHEEEA